MTQQELADHAGVDLKTVYNLESGTRWPIAKTRAAVSAALQWEGDALTAIADDRAAPAPEVILLPEIPETPGDDVRGAVVAALYGPAERRIWSHVRRCLAGTPAGRELFSVPAEAATWPPEAPDGLSGGAPFDLTEKARELLDATPAIDLFTDPYEVIVWRMNRLPYRKRVGMIRELREAVREPAWRAPRPSSARRVGLEEPPHGLTA